MTHKTHRSGTAMNFRAGVDLHLFQTREGLWRVRIDAGDGNAYTHPAASAWAALQEAAIMIGIEIVKTKKQVGG